MTDKGRADQVQGDDPVCIRTGPDSTGDRPDAAMKPAPPDDCR